MDLEGKTCAAVVDLGIANLDKNSERYHELSQYMLDVLKISNLYGYFNSGVLLFDLTRFRNLNYEGALIEVAKINNRFFHDQNVLNSVLQNDYLKISSKWNYLWHIRYKHAANRDCSSDGLFKDYDDARENSPMIVHYASPIKPWDDDSWEFSQLFWKYAKRTPFESELLSKKVDSLIKKNASLRSELKSIKKSYAHRIGSAFVWLPKKILDRKKK
jgi:lipopolysaccharide biosynthesis glycosyltransferase